MIDIGYAPKIKIGKSPSGYFFFKGYGAVGKTYLANALASYSDSGLFYVKTLNDYGISEAGNKDKAKVFFYDRLDMYLDKDIESEIEKYSKDKMVLLDLKDIDRLKEIRNNWGFVDIELGKNKIELMVV